MAEMSFNEAIVKMEEIIKKLDNNIELEEGISLFNESIELTKLCSKKLKEANGKIMEIVKELDQVIEKDSEVE